MGACRLQTSLIRIDVILPVLPLVNVCEAEFPVLVGLIDTRQESLSLLLLRKVEKYFDDLRAIAMNVAFHIHDGAIPVIPDGFIVAQFFRKPLTAENFRMYANYQHFLVIGTIEHTDPSALGKAARRSPEKIMFQFFGARLFETEYLATLRIHSRHHMPNRTVFAGSIDTLKD